MLSIGAFRTFLPAALQTPVGNGLTNRSGDIRNIKGALSHLGYFDDDTENDYITRDLDRSIKNFQRDHGLFIDGRLFPGGETEEKINEIIGGNTPLNHDPISVNTRLARHGQQKIQEHFRPFESTKPSPLNGSPGIREQTAFQTDPLPIQRHGLRLDGPVGTGRTNNPQDVIGLQQTLGALGLIPSDRLRDPTGILDRDTVAGVKNFQRQLGLKEDGQVTPGGETTHGLDVVSAFLQQSPAYADTDTAKTSSPSSSFHEEQRAALTNVAASLVRGIVATIKDEGSTADKINAFAPAVTLALGALGGQGGGTAGAANAISSAFTGAQSFFNGKEALNSDGEILGKLSQFLPAVTSGASAVAGLAGSAGNRQSGTATLNKDALLTQIKQRQTQNARDAQSTKKPAQTGTLTGGNGTDTLNGGAGNDRLQKSTPPIPEKKPEFDATGRMIRENTPPVPERKPLSPELEKVAQSHLNKFQKSGLKQSERFFRNYLDGKGKPIKLTPEEMDDTPTFKKAIQANQKRFEDSMTKGLVDPKLREGKFVQRTEGIPSQSKDQILNLKDGESTVLKNDNVPSGIDFWDRDIGFSEGRIQGDEDQSLSTGSIKLRSRGSFRATRKGNMIEIDGVVDNSIKDIYNFDDENIIDKIVLEPFRRMATEGNARPFLIHGSRLQRLRGFIEIKDDKINSSNFKWQNIDR